MLRNAFLALLFAGLAHADTTIVPLRGDLVTRWDGNYHTIVEVTNLGHAPVSVHRGDVFPVSPEPPCTDPITVLIQPQQSADVPTGCTGLYAYTLESDGPVRVDTVITRSQLIRMPVGFTSVFQHQQVPSAREWLPPHRIAIIPRVRMGAEGTRTNLFVTNPGDHDLTFDLRITTWSPLFPFRDERHVVGPRSTVVIRLANVATAECQLPLVCGSEHKLTFTANGPYYASASAVDHFTGDALFFVPSVIED